MSKSTAAAVCVLVTVPLAGCGNPSAPSTAQVTSAAEFEAPKDLAQGVRCEGFAAVVTDESGINEVGTCVLDDSLLRLVTFDDAEARDSFLARIPAGHAYVRGSTWAVSAETASVAEIVQERVGGEVTVT